MITLPIDRGVGRLLTAATTGTLTQMVVDGDLDPAAAVVILEHRDTDREAHAWVLGYNAGRKETQKA